MYNQLNLVLGKHLVKGMRIKNDHTSEIKADVSDVIFQRQL